MLPRTFTLRAAALLAALALGAAGLVAPSAQAEPSGHTDRTPVAKPDPRKRLGLFVDPTMKGATHGAYYRKYIGKYAQALWIIPEEYSTRKVENVVRTYTERAANARKTPILAIYGIPDRDCGMYSSGGLPNADKYKAWIKQISRGLKDQHALVILEPDAVPFYGDPRCHNASDRLALLRYASRVLSKSGSWVYLDAGHSDWRPYDTRAQLLKKAGIAYDRGFSTNVSNFRPTDDEQAYADELLQGLRDLGVRGKHYVVDSSRNGNPDPINGDVINPTWARLGKPPRLVFDHAFDGKLWVKHPGESDGQVNGGGPSGHWCDMLADRLIDGTSDQTSCPQ